MDVDVTARSLLTSLLMSDEEVFDLCLSLQSVRASDETVHHEDVDFSVSPGSGSVRSDGR